MKQINNVRKAKVIGVVNGNTMDMEIDLGFGMKIIRRIDLARISPNEQFSDKGDKAAQWMQGYFVHEVPDVILQFSNRNPSDRLLAEVWDDLGQNVSDFILEKGWGELDETRRVDVIG